MGLIPVPADVIAVQHCLFQLPRGVHRSLVSRVRTNSERAGTGLLNTQRLTHNMPCELRCPSSILMMTVKLSNPNHNISHLLLQTLNCSRTKRCLRHVSRNRCLELHLRTGKGCPCSFSGGGRCLLTSCTRPRSFDEAIDTLGQDIAHD